MAKQKPNAYSMFVKEVAKRRQQRGEFVIFNNLFKELDEEWKNMSDDRKQRYKDIAKSGTSWYKGNDAYTPAQRADPRHLLESDIKQRPDLMAKLLGANPREAATATPEDIKSNLHGIKPEPSGAVVLCRKRPRDEDCKALVVAREPKKPRPGVPHWGKGSTKLPERYLDKWLYNLRCAAERVVRGTAHRLTKVPLLSISVNIMCCHRSEGFDECIPLELAIYSCNIEGDRHDPYHVLIDAGKIPPNFVTLATEHARVNHHITLPPKGYPEHARSDYKKIYKEICDYSRLSDSVLMVDDERNLKQVQLSLDWLYKKACEGISGPVAKTTWTFVSAKEMVGCAYNYAYQKMLGHQDPKFALYYYISLKLDGSTVNHNSAIKCDYHRDIETEWCALSCATRVFLYLAPILEEIRKMYNYAKSPQFRARQAALLAGPNIGPEVPAIKDEPTTEASEVLAIEGPKSDTAQKAAPAPPEGPPTIVSSSQPDEDKPDEEHPDEEQPMELVLCEYPYHNPDASVDQSPFGPEDVSSSRYFPPTVEPQMPPKPKKEQEQLVIASSRTVYNYAPDIY